MIKTQDNQMHQVLKNFVIVFIPILIIVMILTYLYIKMNIENEKSIIKIKQMNIAEIVNANVKTAFEGINADGSIILNSNELKIFIQDNSITQNSSEVKRMFSNMGSSKKTYNSIRIINNDGYEEIRVNYENGNSQPADDSALQYKGDWYYFSQGMKLDAGQIYISPLDMNSDNNGNVKLENSVIHFIIPIFNENNERKGILVLDYLAQNLLNQIKSDSNNTMGMETLLLNEEGYYLINDGENFLSTNDDEKNISFGEEQPDFWKSIQNNESGYFEDNENIFCFASIYPLHGYHNIRWILVEYVPMSDLSVFNNEANQRIVTISVLLMFVFMFISLVAAWLLMLKKEAGKREKLTENIFKNSKEGMIIMDAQTRIIYVNPAFSQITGYSEEEVMGRKPSEFKKDKRLELLYNIIRNAVNDYGSWQGEILDQRKDGTTYPRYMTVSKVFDSKSNELINYLEVFEDLTSAKMIEATIDKIKNYDEMTGLPTQILFEQKMKELIKKYENITLIILQITNFDALYDNLGKKFGAEIIKEATNRIKTFLNEADLIGKLNRDQFVVARVNNGEKLELDHFLNKLLSFLQETIVIGDKKSYLNISIGIAMFQEHSADIDKLIDFANIAKNYAIQTGDNTYVVYEKEIEHNYLKNLKLETELRSAIKKNELSLNFQPQITVGTEEIIGMEALLRWNNDELGRVGPDQFIPVAEKTELIIPIGEWVLDEAIKQNKRWIELTQRRLVVAVNLSPVQFKNDDLHEVIQQLLDKYELPPELLEVEVTEGVLVNNFDSIKSQLDKIEELGVKVSIDDFGTGYSSLKYLQRLNFDKLKIDREFIKDYPEKDNGNIAKMIINLANQIGLKVLAEGVETKEQFIFLKENRCDEIQGYYFYKPMTVSDFERMIIDDKILKDRDELKKD